MVMSLDGFVTSPDGPMNGCSSGSATTRWVEPPRARRGRRPRDGAPQLRDHGAALGRVRGADCNRDEQKPKAVFSHTLEKAEWTAEIFGGDLRAEIADLKARDDEGTVLIHGGPDFAKSVTRLGLVDEYQLMTVPIAIGAVHSPFTELVEHLKLAVVERSASRAEPSRRSWCRSERLASSPAWSAPTPSRAG